MVKWIFRTVERQLVLYKILHASFTTYTEAILQTNQPKHRKDSLITEEIYSSYQYVIMSWLVLKLFHDSVLTFEVM
jgi:hypothetical protein